MSVNTLQKHRSAALAKGWLSAEKRRDTKGWRTPTLRCAVPDHVELNAKDEELALVLTSQFADIEDDTDTASDTASDTANDKTTTPGNAAVTHDAVSLCYENSPMLYQDSAEKAGCCITAVSLESCNPLPALETLPEVLEVIKRSSKRKTEGAVTENRTGSLPDKAPGVATTPEQRPLRTTNDGTKGDNLVKAASLLRRLPSTSNADIARRCGLSSDEVRQLRTPPAAPTPEPTEPVEPGQRPAYRGIR
jgi:hypothetical protein